MRNRAANQRTCGHGNQAMRKSIGSLLRPDLVTETVDERLACDTGSDPHLAGSLYRSKDEGRRAVNVVTAVDPEGMHRELLERLARAVATPAGGVKAPHEGG